MDLEQLLQNADPNIIIFVFSSLFAFLSWVLKGLITQPIDLAKATFNTYQQKRIEALAEARAILSFIAYFPEGNETIEYKNQLQVFLIKGSNAAYFSKSTFDKALRISIGKDTDEKMYKEVIEEINSELTLIISKLKEEINFYQTFANLNPVKRFLGYTLLLLKQILSIILALSVIFLIIYGFIKGGWIVKIILSIFSLIVITLGPRILKLIS
ncbi:MAG: hypothetical protein J0M30_14460 [Chitinophagales bacterium]|nr:hypothetical protein [Chitinophagales bacterium]